MVGCAVNVSAETVVESETVTTTQQSEETTEAEASLMVAVISLVSSLAVAIISCVISSISLSNSNRIKSYEYMIKHRLKIYSLLQKRFAEFNRVTSVGYIEARRCDMSAAEYSELMSNSLSDVEIVLSRTERQEFLLLDDCAELKRAAIEYFNQNSAENKENLLKQTEVVSVFVDIYLWTLWQYLQQLYNNKKARLHGLFDREFSKTYKRIKDNYAYGNEGRLPQFFKKYDDVEKMYYRYVKEMVEKDGN